ncbi:hypothetical protein B0T25DRAFT_572124 [Lasiosphaeria hispida]|uniref:Uncharacterized protein n=1 Tax=Lasiosphaeria hispida TaxID=260671 RepID=A0AAJ0HCK1_9PEZI|nr:hypothetical protein B0T25DRAFT_572124 [Lasiosphaeria hispida]
MPSFSDALAAAARLFTDIFPFWGFLCWVVLHMESAFLRVDGHRLPLFRWMPTSWLPIIIIVGGGLTFVVVLALGAVIFFIASVMTTLTVSLLATAFVTVAEVSVVFWIYFVMVWLDVPGGRGRVQLGLPRHLKTYCFVLRVLEEVLPALVLPLVKMPGISCNLYRFDQWVASKMYGSGALMTQLYPADSVAMHANLALYMLMQTLWALAWYENLSLLLEQAEHYLRHNDDMGRPRPVPAHLAEAEWKWELIFSMSRARLCARIIYQVDFLIKMQSKMLKSAGYTGWTSSTYLWTMKSWVWCIRAQWDPAWFYAVDMLVEWLEALDNRQQEPAQPAANLEADR